MPGVHALRWLLANLMLVSHLLSYCGTQSVSSTDDDSSCKQWQAPQLSDPYKWMTSLATRERAQTMPGNQRRLRQALERYHSGSNLTITMLGGSVTAGSGSNEGHGYVTWATMILNTTLGPRIQVINGGVGGVLSSYMALCNKLHAPSNSDIIFVEYSLNDMPSPTPPMDNRYRRPYERLLRKLLLYPNNPAVIIYNGFRWFIAGSIFESEENGNYWVNAEREFSEFASFYDLPVLSVKAACYPLMKQGIVGYQVDVYRWGGCGYTDPGGDAGEKARFDRTLGKAFYADCMHPDGNTGHRVMGEILAQFILDANAGLSQRQFSLDEQVSAVQRELPAPMLRNNWQTEQDSCFIAEQLKLIVKDHEGWEWFDDGHHGFHKFGYRATEPGKVLRLVINTAPPEPLQAHGQHLPVVAELAVIKSHQHMGMAEVRCEGGCTCDTMTVDGLHEFLFTQMMMVPLTVSRSSHCEIVITTLQETRSGNHTFKLGAVMVSEEPSDNQFQNGAAVEWIGANMLGAGN